MILIFIQCISYCSCLLLLLVVGPENMEPKISDRLKCHALANLIQSLRQFILCGIKKNHMSKVSIHEDKQQVEEKRLMMKTHFPIEVYKQITASSAELSKVNEP